MGILSMDMCSEYVLLQMRDTLRKALQRQEKEWSWSKLNKRKRCLSPEDLQTKYEQRQECARQIRTMSRYFDAMSPAVFSTSVAIMDSALIKVNIKWKYLSCFAAACFFIGSKWIEDDEHQPTIGMLVNIHQRQWKEVDLRRMEEKILVVLDWEIPRCTYMDFLPLLTQLVEKYHPRQRLPPFDHVLHNAELVMLQEFSFELKPAAVALGALQYTLYYSRAWIHIMSSTILTLQDYFLVSGSELYKIDEMLHAEDQVQHRKLKSNKAYFPKVFELPSFSFCPDHRLHDITEEREESEQNLEPSVDCLLGSDASISDHDSSEDKNPASPCETTVENVEVPVEDCTLVKDYIQQVNGQDESLADSPEYEQFESTVLDSDSSENVLERQSSTSQTSSGYTHSNKEQFHQERNDNEHYDSGCEEDDGSYDERDPCGEQDICGETDICSEHDSGSDQDSDFQDSSPCRQCFVKAGVSQLQGQALAFD